MELRTNRRDFVKLASLGVAASSVGGWRGTVLAETTEAGNLGILTVRLSDYPALQQDFGSVRLAINLFSNAQWYPIIITRDLGATFHVLSSECTHASCLVATYQDSAEGMRCPCHGSFFAIDGSRISGPAQRPLERYEFTYDGNDRLSIHVPGAAFSVAVTLISIAPGARVRLRFPTISQVEYRASFREKVSDPWSAIQFATTSAGVADKAFLSGTGGVATIYLDRSTATKFYAVRMVPKLV